MYRTGPLFAAVAVTIALASCGGGGSPGNDGASAKPPFVSTPAASQAPPCVRSSDRDADETANACGGDAGKAADAGGCQDRLDEFVGRMDDLRQSLLAGLSYSEYVVRVRAIRDAYEAVPVERLGVGCLKGPASNAEDAFNQYLRAANAWGECAATEGCAASEIEGKLQRRWRIASKSLDAVGPG